MPSRVTGGVSRWRSALAIGLLVAAGACRDTLAPNIDLMPPNQVTVVNVPPARTIVVVNRTSTPIFAQVWGGNLLAVIDYVLCVDPDRCESIAPGASRTYKYPEPFQGVPEKEAVVSWWHLSRGSDGKYGPVDWGRKVVPL